MVSVGPGEGRIARFERVFCPAAIALAMAQDAVDDARIGNKRDDAHAGAAGSASQGVSLEDFPDQSSPGAAGLPGEAGIVPRLGRGSAGNGAVGLSVGADDSAPIRVGAVEALAVASRVGNMRADPVNPIPGDPAPRAWRRCAGPAAYPWPGCRPRVSRARPWLEQGA